MIHNDWPEITPANLLSPPPAGNPPPQFESFSLHRNPEHRKHARKSTLRAEPFRSGRRKRLLLSWVSLRESSTCGSRTHTVARYSALLGNYVRQRQPHTRALMALRRVNQAAHAARLYV